MSRKTTNTMLVREYVRELIMSQGLKPGDLLPGEGDIALTLDISKSCVREATRALEIIGLIEIRHGIGLVVRDFNLDAIGEIFHYGFVLDPSIVLDLYDVRRQLETSLIPRVIEQIREEHIENCKALLDHWTKLTIDHQPTYEVDQCFHEMLYSVVDNRMLTSLCHIFWKSFRELETHQLLKRKSVNNDTTQLSIVEDHRKLLQAIEQKDKGLASQLMFDHFGSIESPLTFQAAN